MELDRKTAEEIAKRHLATSEPLKCLGWGIGGFVYLSPDLRTAVKVHRSEEGFQTELRVYRRLAALKISQLHGLTIPKLRGVDATIRSIQMDFVNAPFLLDFAGVLFKPPDFSAEVMAHWHDQLDEMFGANVHIAHAVYASLARHGLYYVDFRPTNMKLEGHPDYQPLPPPDDADDF
jgi:hypothetical protein